MTALNLRRIGGSDVAAILGVSDYSTAFDVWLRIVEGFSPPASNSMALGKRFERAIGAWYADEHKVKVEWFEESIEHPLRPWQRLTPDLRIVSRPGEIGDVKRARRALDRHGHPGTDEIADYELVQLQTYLEGLSSLDEQADVGHLIVHDLEHDELVTWTTRRDPELGGIIVEACERFWRDHVLTKKPPSMSGSDVARMWLERRKPKDTLPPREATPAEVKLALEYHDLSQAIGQLGDRIDVIKNLLRESIGDHRAIRGPFGSISYAAISEQRSPDFERAAGELALELLKLRDEGKTPLAFLEQTAARKALEHAEKNSKVTRNAYRKLAPYWRREEKTT